MSSKSLLVNNPESLIDLQSNDDSPSLPPQVLATGLSGLYSSLPTKLEVPNEEWHCLHKEDWLKMPSLVQFLNSLEFCNAVIQVKTRDEGRTHVARPH